MVRILFFGRLREAAGLGERQVDLPPGVMTGADLIGLLGAGDDRLRAALEAPAVKIVADDAVVPRAAKITGAREIAFLPPVSGG